MTSHTPVHTLHSDMSVPHQVQSRPLQHVHQLLQLGVAREDEVVVHPQHVLGGYLGNGQVSSGEPTLRVETRDTESELRGQEAATATTGVCVGPTFPKGMM